MVEMFDGVEWRGLIEISYVLVNVGFEMIFSRNVEIVWVVKWVG